MKQFYKVFIICGSIFSLMLFPSISQCQWANPAYGGYYNYGQPQYPPYGVPYGATSYGYYGQPPQYNQPQYPPYGFPYGSTSYGYYGQPPQYSQPNYWDYYQPQSYGWNQPNYGWNSYNNMYPYSQNPWIYGYQNAYYLNQNFPYNSYPVTNPWAPIPPNSIMYIPERGQIVYPGGNTIYLDPYINMIAHSGY